MGSLNFTSNHGGPGKGFCVHLVATTLAIKEPHYFDKEKEGILERGRHFLNSLRE